MNNSVIPFNLFISVITQRPPHTLFYCHLYASVGGCEHLLYIYFISFIFIDVNVYRLKYEKDWVIERIIYYVRLYKQKAKVRDKGIINARMGEKKLVI